MPFPYSSQRNKQVCPSYNNNLLVEWHAFSKVYIPKMKDNIDSDHLIHCIK